MGSHGGATAEGQKHLLARYGVTEQNIGAPVRATMDAIQVTQMPDGTPLFVDRFALESDGIVLLNRVKPHTTVPGSISEWYHQDVDHRYGQNTWRYGNGIAITVWIRFHTVLPHAAQCLLPHIPFSFGLALVEDAFDQTAHIEAIFPDQLLGREKALLTMATERMARLHFDEIDVLVIDQIGKEISGAGFDPNVAGRNSRGVNGFDHPKIDKLVLLDLTDMTHGNATGVGMADVITQQLFNRIDFAATYANVITSAYLDGAAIPIVMPNSEDAVRLAVKTVLRVKPENTRIVRIKNTLALTEIFVSTPLLEAVSHHSMLEQTSSPLLDAMDASGSFPSGVRKNKTCIFLPKISNFPLLIAFYFQLSTSPMPTAPYWPFICPCYRDSCCCHSDCPVTYSCVSLFDDLCSCSWHFKRIFTWRSRCPAPVTRHRITDAGIWGYRRANSLCHRLGRHHRHSDDGKWCCRQNCKWSDSSCLERQKLLLPSLSVVLFLPSLYFLIRSFS